MDEDSLKIPKFRWLPGRWTHGGSGRVMCWESGVRGEGMEALSPFPHILPYAALPPGYSSVSFIISFCNKTVNISKFPPKLNPSSKSIECKEGVWEALIYSQLVRAEGTTWAFDWHLKWGLEASAPNLWNLMLAPYRVSRIELSSRIPCWCPRIAYWFRKVGTEPLQ